MRQFHAQKAASFSHLHLYSPLHDRQWWQPEREEAVVKRPIQRDLKLVGSATSQKRRLE